MSPTIFKYQKILIRIYPRDHFPCHVHALIKGEQDYEMKIVFELRDGKVTGVSYENIKDKKSFPPSIMKDLKKLVTAYKEIMANDFIDYVQRNKEIHPLIELHKLP